MRTFPTLNDLNNYIPNCVICSKPMRFVLEGMISPIAPSKPRWGSGNERLRLKLELKEGVLRSKHKNHNVGVELATNQIVEGQGLIDRLVINGTQVHKLCPTCHFKINTRYETGNVKKTNCFPALTLQSEELHYTLKGGKDVNISKYYAADPNAKESAASIRLNGKYLPPVPLDFNKLSDLEHLNKRLATIILFH